MKALITGGTGFIGSRLALRCLAEGQSVCVLGQDRNPAEAENKRLIEERGGQVAIVSVTEREPLFELFRGVDTVFHLAAAQHEVHVPDQHFWDVNVEGTRNILDASVAAGVGRFVHGSTIGVYRWTPPAPVRESSPLEPDNIYGVTKLAGEELVRLYGEKLRYVIVRIGETYGPGDRRLLKLFKGTKRGVFVQIGSGENLHHLVYIDDLIDALLLASTSERALGKAFVVVGARAVSTREMIETVARVLGVRSSRLRVPLGPVMFAAGVLESILRPMGIQPPLHRRRMDFFRKSFSFSVAEARELLGYQPKVELEEGAAKTAEWYVDQGLL